MHHHGVMVLSLFSWLIAVLLSVLPTTPPPASAPADVQPPAAAAAPQLTWLHTKGNKMLDENNKPYQIKAVSWFGLETPDCAPNGLWQITIDQALATIKRQGFNTVRLPYSNQCLAAGADKVGSIDYTKNPDLQGKTPQQLMDIVVQKAGAQGLQIILDRHRIISSQQSPLWYTDKYPETRWISDWQKLAARYKGNKTVIGADLHNEPHGPACWGCGDKNRDWSLAAKRAGDAILSVNPNWLIIVEGVDKSQTGKYYWWGGQLADVKNHPIKLAKAGRLVYSPHDYPASVHSQPWFNAPNYPNNLPGVWNKTWGYIHANNKAPILLGEFGTFYQTKSDKQWLQKLVAYLDARNMSFSYWSFNPNSGDTGGTVKNDWVTDETAKLKALEPLLK